ncbi:L-alanine-DL-glutamate epimerase [Streptoalloteichus tenebrarius]|uniref:Dipeptide epimerase n=1 Tax=Streptoalloteichus tenebrarius (strain ATCC 17920 / DSM 40477 / JCM 4838 / CBS 697.72 / NBRC 16177 / NCIMB 11028 / NRRL B-12390 / A12253. 1 / ISP 5477) TaxID=1933 RepID=A0ABT1HPF6_STRSD|nr:dipeptide epimerase [Streptoalloteichus tenebrarius]MCP2257360.1 L-alanine-DL-glutamate epimerase [Streptoalloteichus tenebrarius]BFF04273.1 dipeptide epimerase [Streptoalloteichus tenebrarius]
MTLSWKLDWTVVPLALREPFRISRSVMTSRDAVQITLEHDGTVGDGEVVTSVYFGLDVRRITDLLAAFAPVLADFPDPASLLAALPDAASCLAEAPGVLAAVDAAAHDLVGKQVGLPVHHLLGQPTWRPVTTARTIGITEPEHAATTAKLLVDQGFGTLKLKLGSPDPADDLARVAAVRAVAPDARLVLDPNGAWRPDQAARLLEEFARHDVDAVEQPIPPGTPDELARLARSSPVPVIADEDATSLADVERLAGAVHGVNVKLAKCGGVSVAREIIATARAAGTDVMLGCLVASSLGLAPAVHLTGHARWVDLDGHLLLADDPWTGIGGHDGVLRLSGRPGLGVRPARAREARS